MLYCFTNISFSTQNNFISAGLKARVRTKRQYNLQRYRPRVTKNTPTVSLNEVVENAANDADNNGVSESAFMLKPGVMPPARQTFYQVSLITFNLSYLKILLAYVFSIAMYTCLKYKRC